MRGRSGGEEEERAVAFDQPGSGVITLALINKLRKHTGPD